MHARSRGSFWDFWKDSDERGLFLLMAPCFGKPLTCMMGGLTFVCLALMGCCLGETSIGTAARFSSRDNRKSAQESSRTYIAETVFRRPFVTHLPNPFTLIASFPRIYQRQVLQMSTLLFYVRKSLINTLQGLTKATQLYPIESLRVGQRGRTPCSSYHGLEWRLLVCPLQWNWTTYLFVSSSTASGRTGR